MIPKDCKRLAEVDFPIAVVSKHSAREKTIRHGLPSTLHLWWARRPLAACRAMLLGLLLPDPCDPLCPEDFKKRARELLAQTMTTWKRPGKTDAELRVSLLSFIGESASWDVAMNPAYLAVGRGLVKAAHPDETPLVVDPFSGGGSIPLEALRLGCDAFASDLNPVACLILKVMLEDIPRQGSELAQELRRVGGEIKQQAQKELAEFYPRDADGATPIAYLWARTIRCESPNCGAEIPLARSFWLCTKANRRWALKHKVVRPGGGAPGVEFEIFEPKNDGEVPGGTVAGAKATCPCCGAVVPPERTRTQLSEQRGGADAVVNGGRVGGALMLAVVTLRPGETGRHYRLPTERDYRAVWKAQQRLRAVLDVWERGGRKGLCPVPDEEIPRTELRRISVPIYGIDHFRDMFTSRQLVVLSTLARSIATTSTQKAVNHLLALSLDKTADLNNANTCWKPDAECPVHALARHDIGMTWDFAEAVAMSEASGSFYSAYERTADSIAAVYCGSSMTATVQSADACAHPLPDHSAALWFTDPPYYDSVPYAHLSDFFYVWMRRCLVGEEARRMPALAPKREECVVDRPHSQVPEAKTAVQYEDRIGTAMSEGRRLTQPDGIACVVFAHKTTEGWEALLSGMIQGGWVITSSWPITTEMQSRLNARDNASLAASVHLVCRPRPEDASVGDWGEVLRELPKRVGDWMERLQGEGIRGADLVFACMGPALEIFSRYRKVETADGREVKLAEYLTKVWEVVGRTALEQVLGTAEAKVRNGAVGVLEEDARLTALFLWTLQSTSGESEEDEGEDLSDDEDEEETAPKGKTKGFILLFDVVRRFAQPLGVELPKWEGRIIETKKGAVRLMAVSERARQLFGDDGADAVADWLEREPVKNLQQVLFPELEQDRTPKIRGRRGRIALDAQNVEMKTEHAATTLDRVHAAMLLQAGGQANGLRALLKAEQERGPDFLRLANALSALYPKASEEKRLLDAMLLAVPR